MKLCKVGLALCVLVAAGNMASLSNAKAADSTYVFLASKHNLDYTQRTCERAIRAEATTREQAAAPSPKDASPLSPEKIQVLETATKCRSVTNFGELARKAENELINEFAANSKCRGVSLRRDGEEGYDPTKLADEIRKLREKAPVWWELDIDYNPRSETYRWYLFPFAGAVPAGPSLGGEGDTVKNAADICNVLITRNGAPGR